jgi:hypothetical protein
LALIPIVHERRVASAAEAERLFRALGEKRVSVRGCKTPDPARIAALVAAVEPKREHSISFEDGILDAAAHDAIAALATARYQVFCVETRLADLRIWPWLPRAWVLATSASAEAIGSALGTPIAVGEQQIGEMRVEVKDGEGWVIRCETTEFAAAARLFRAIAGEPIRIGNVTNLVAGVQPLVERALVAMRTNVHVVMEVDVKTARELGELFAGESFDWQAGGIIIGFPAGAITGYFRSHEITDRKRVKWHRRIDKALAKARR